MGLCYFAERANPLRRLEWDKAMNNDLRQLMNEISTHMTQFHERLESRGQEIQLTGGDEDVVKKLISGADAMKDSGNIYLSWARHYVALSEGGAAESEEGEEDSDDFQF